MFKKLILAVLLALPMTAFAQKLGTVEIETVFTLMPETKEMQTMMPRSSMRRHFRLLRKNLTSFSRIIRR